MVIRSLYLEDCMMAPPGKDNLDDRIRAWGGCLMAKSRRYWAFKVSDESRAVLSMNDARIETYTIL